MGFFSSIRNLFRDTQPGEDTAPPQDTQTSLPDEPDGEAEPQKAADESPASPENALAPEEPAIPSGVIEAIVIEEIPSSADEPLPPQTDEAAFKELPETADGFLSETSTNPPVASETIERETFVTASPAPVPSGFVPQAETGADAGLVAPDDSHEPAQARTPEETAMALALRDAEPRLSVWLGIVLEGVEHADALLWERVAFLLRSLEAPEEEIRHFINTFQAWLEDMEYEDIEEFRSELQYRLALALDLEDEEDERSRLMLKLSEGLAKTREHITRNLNNLFLSGRTIDEAFWEELEEILIMADVGFETAHALTEALRKRAQLEGITDASVLRDAMRQEILEVFKPTRRINVVNPPEVVLVIGVNGVGKTTTIAKLCHRAVLQGKKVLLVAGDTFRAAATEQLEIWAKRAGAGFYAKGHGADPAAVAYEAIDKAVAESYDTVFVDTAGRLHTKVNLMEELVKVSRVLGKRHPGAPHRTILILDSTTGQNALSQVKLFNAACAIDELILTKLDGTAKGGIAVAVAMQYGIPISFIGLGEKMDDLRPFDAESYVTALLGLEKEE